MIVYYLFSRQERKTSMTELRNGFLLFSQYLYFFLLYISPVFYIKNFQMRHSFTVVFFLINVSFIYVFMLLSRRQVIFCVFCEKQPSTRRNWILCLRPLCLSTPDGSAGTHGGNIVGTTPAQVTSYSFSLKKKIFVKTSDCSSSYSVHYL